MRPVPLLPGLVLALTSAVAVAGLPAAGSAQVGTDPAAEAARAYRQAHEVEILDEYLGFLAMPNVARNADDIRANARYIRDRLREVGARARLLEVEAADGAPAPPFVFGTLEVPGATRTLGIYLHYDGQPADGDRWTHAPWQPVLYSASMEDGGEPIPLPAPGEAVDPEWRIYARSAADDKAPFPALLAVLRSFREAGLRPTSNLVFFFEGEEEAASPNLDRYLETYRELLDPVDLWLFFDGPSHQSGRPQLTFGVRGTTGLEVTVYGASRNLHSGHYGNWAPDTPQLLAHLLASMKDPWTGEVLVEGWYESADPISPGTRAALEAMPPVDAGLRDELGLLWSEGAPATLPERLMVPALTVRGITSGGTGPLTRNVIPNTATASLGIRLVSGNDPEHMKDLVEAHIRQQGYHIVREDPDRATRLAHPRIARVIRGGGYRATRSSLDDPALQGVIAAAREAARAAFPPGEYGDDPLVLTPTMGGSLPLYLFDEVLGKPFVNVNVANHDNNQHAPDENLRVGNLWYAVDLYARLLSMAGPGA